MDPRSRWPCGDGSWGRIGAPAADWLHVSAIDGNDASGDGTPERPFATVPVALEAARILPVGTDRVLAIWPGNYDAAVTLLPGEGWDGDGVAFLGCAPDESVLVALDPGAPVLDAALPETVRVRGLGLVGGTSGLVARAGARVHADRIAASASGQVGVAAFDAGTALNLRQSQVTSPDAAGCGWGIGSWGAATTVLQSAVAGARGSAIFADGGSLKVDAAYLVDTLPDGNGRYRPRDPRAVGAGRHPVELRVGCDRCLHLPARTARRDDRGVVLDVTGAAS